MFDFIPNFLIVATDKLKQQYDTSDIFFAINPLTMGMHLLQQSNGNANASIYGYANFINWNNNSVSWYTYSYNWQSNVSGIEYQYMGIII